MITLTEKQKRIMFNGKTLKSNFRRGFWLVDNYKAFIGGKPSNIQLKATTKAFLYYGGVVAFYVDIVDNTLIINKNKGLADNVDIKAIIQYIADNNKDKYNVDIVDGFLDKATKTTTSQNIKTCIF